jgi:cell wall-associated NlpC family hydrolase
MHYKPLYLLAFVITQGCVTLAPEPVEAPRTADGPLPPQRVEALLQVLSAVGVSYRNGGNSHADGFDCSGLVAHVYREAWGIALPRTARAQSEFGVPVTRAELQPGDLVFYNTLNAPFSHVGIYVGDGKFVHAPKQGAEVRMDPVDGRYWARRFDGARRILPAS